MAIQSFFDLVSGAANVLGIGLPDYILVVTVLGSLIFMGVDLRRGIMILFLLLAAEFVVFTLLGFNTFKVFIVFLLVFTVMALSIIISFKKSEAMGVV